jgi:hypothetical protein
MLAVLLAWHSLGAQAVHGMVRGEIDGTGLPGVMVALRDAASGDLAQTLTNFKGEFALRAPAAGSYVLRLRRIGFRLREIEIRLSQGDTTVAIAMSEVPTAIAAVVTKDRGQCRAHPQSGSEIWALWDDAEVAMLNAAITMREQTFRFDAEFIRREYDLPSAQLQDISLRDSTIRGGRPWTSVRPHVLDRSGFAVGTATEMTVIAPDLPVLLSREFLDRHCFAIHPAPASSPDLVGLDFSPTEKGRLVDIRGTFWLDRRSADLRYLNFYYTGFPYSMDDTLAGGRVDFVRLASESWILSSWQIRAPLPPLVYLQHIAATAGFDPFLDARAVEADDPHFRATQFRITGGNVREVRRDDGTDSSQIWSAPVSALRATVTVQSGVGTMVASGATVQLVGSRKQAVTDSSGVARIEGLTAGDYLVQIASPLQAALRLPPTSVAVTVAPPADVEIPARVMSAREAMRTACGSMSSTRGILVGTVTRNGAPEPNARVLVRSDMDPHFAPPEVQPSTDGSFRICDLPKGEALTVLAILADRKQAKAHVTIAGDRIHEFVELVLPPDRQ